MISFESRLTRIKVAEFYLGPGGSKNYDFEHIQVCGSIKTFSKNTQLDIGTLEMQGIVDMYSDAWYWYTMHDWAR